MDKSLFGQYIEERLGKEIVESEKGFATFYFIQDGCYIEDIYVKPEHRGEHYTLELFDTIAKIALDRGYTKLLGSVLPAAKGSTGSLKALLSHGWELHSVNNNLVILVKDISTLMERKES